MSYQNVVDGLIRVLKTITDFSDGNITANDYRVLNSGRSQCIVLCPGGFKSEPSTIGGLDSEYWVDWDVNIELYVRYDVTDDIVAQRIATYRESILEAVAKYPFLNATPSIHFARITRGDKPVPVFRPNGEGPIFWMQLMLLTAREEWAPVTALE